MESDALRMLEGVIAEHRSRLTDKGWTVVVRATAERGAAVDLSHPLHPGTTSFVLTGDESPQSAAQHLEGCFASFETEIRLASDTRVRPSVAPMLGQLRAAGGWPRNPDASETIRSAGHILAEHHLLSDAEAAWLSDALDHDNTRRPPDTQ